MPNNVHYNFMQQVQPAQSSYYNYQQPHRQHSHHASPTPKPRSPSTYSTKHLSDNASIHYQQTTPSISSNQSSAYFLDRIDLENYTTHTLKQTVESTLSKTKSKGLKVKISLPDDGLIIDNILDPNQSWIFKKSELLYFWRDPYYLNVIVVVTINRSRHHSNRPYSASIFRLRGNNSAQSFLQRAQQFFANLSASMSTSNISKSNRNKSIDRLNSSFKNRPKANSSSTTIDRFSSPIKRTSSRHQSPRTNSTTPIRRVTRAEFDPGRIPTDSNDLPNHHRTLSETTSSIDSQTTSSSKEILAFTRKLNDDEEDKLTTISSSFSAEQIAELMRELKDLRSEIASLKLEKRIPSATQSRNTSPLATYPEQYKQTIDSSVTPSSPSFPDITSQSEIDAETQTDFSLTNSKRRQLSKKNKKTMIGTSVVSTLSKKKTQQLQSRNSRRTLSNSSTNTLSDQERTIPKLSSRANDLSNDTNKLVIHEQYQTITVSAPPRPVLIRNQNSFLPLDNSTSYVLPNGNQILSSSNSTEEGSSSQSASVTIEKEMPKFLSPHNPSSNSELMGSQTPIMTAATTSFHSSLEKPNISSEHIYENIPILIQPSSNREPFYSIPIINVDTQQQQQNQFNDFIYYINGNNRESESQQQQHIPGQAISNSPSPAGYNSSEVQSSAINIQQQKPQITSTGRHRNQPIYFANHLTNPLFNVDKQLLINTIANQFGVDLNSPQLQQLITNQHLFAARKRTFANMVWQLTPDEETALCSSPISSQMNMIDIHTIDSNNSAARSILKATKRFRSTSKRRNISWNSALE